MPKALIVDDNSENRYLLQCLLTANGFDVTSASNGREALEQANELKPDLVLSDILMPVMDGFSLCREWKQSPRLSPIPFVFYTATYTEPKDQDFALSLGADLFIVKPTEPSELVRLVHQVLEQRNAGQLQAHAAQITDETPYLKQYNEVLIGKLEDKLLEVEQANQRLLIKKFAIESSKAGIAMADLSGRFNYVNAPFVSLWCQGDQDLLGQSLEILFPNAEQRVAVLNQLKESHYWSGQLAGQFADGSKFITHTEIHSVRDSQDTPLCLMIACSDITEQERMRQELQRAQRLESLSHFAVGIAHDFNNLLTAIYANLNLSDVESMSEPERTQRASLLRAYERARDMTRRLLNFGKGASSPRQVVSIRAIVEESCKLSLVGSGTKLSLDFSEPLGNVNANATELSEVFCNIALNARQAMQNAGQLSVSAKNRTVNDNDQRALSPGQYVVIQFRDCGPGIDAAAQQRIFEPFVTSKRDGSGLGLAMSRAIVSGYGGYIGLTSTPGSGATFEVWLPATDQAIASQHPAPVRDISSGTGRILVLDDDELISRILARLLEKQGYEVVTATNGEEAIELYMKARAHEQPFDLLILDLTIRHGLGGAATLQALQKIDRDVVALACSGLADDATATQVIQQGFAGLLTKPFLSHELASMVKAAMATRAK